MFFFNRNKNKNTNKKKPLERPWEELGMTQDQYEKAASLIYGPKDDFTSFLNRPQTVLSSQAEESHSSTHVQTKVMPEPELMEKKEWLDMYYPDAMNESVLLSSSQGNEQVEKKEYTPSSTLHTNGDELKQHLQELKQIVGMKELKQTVQEMIVDVKMRREKRLDNLCRLHL